MPNNERISAKLTELEDWERLLKYPEFRRVEEYCSQRIVLLQNEIVELSKSVSQDSAVKIIALLNRIDEIKTLGKRVDFKKSEILKMKKEQ